MLFMYKRSHDKTDKTKSITWFGILSKNEHQDDIRTVIHQEGILLDTEERDIHKIVTERGEEIDAIAMQGICSAPKFEALVDKLDRVVSPDDTGIMLFENLFNIPEHVIEWIPQPEARNTH